MFDITIEIERAPRDVFAQLARIEDAPRWYSAVKTVERRDSDPVRLGTRARFTRQLGGAIVENEVEVSEFDPNTAMTLSSVSGPTPFVYSYRLEPKGDGTLLRLQGQISGDGLSGPLILLKPLAETFFRRGMAENLSAFKRIVEAS